MACPPMAACPDTVLLSYWMRGVVNTRRQPSAHRVRRAARLHFWQCLTKCSLLLLLLLFRVAPSQPHVARFSPPRPSTAIGRPRTAMSNKVEREEKWRRVVQTMVSPSLSNDELGLLKAREHALPVPVQVALEERALPICPSSPSAPSPQNKVKREEKWRQVVHSLLRWMRTRKVWAALGQKLKALSGLNMDNKKWLEWALGDQRGSVARRTAAHGTVQILNGRPWHRNPKPCSHSFLYICPTWCN